MPDEFLREARESGRWLRQRSDRVEGGYFVRDEFSILNAIDHADPTGATRVQIKNTDLLNFLSPVTEARAFDSADSRRVVIQKISLKTKAAQVVLQFIKLFFDEIRKRICKTNKVNFSVGKEMALALTSLAHWLAAHFGIVHELAKVTASAVLVAIASATKGAFCRLTAKGALDALLMAAH